ncbi:MAG: class I SAM-dependent methyltransferase [Dehalococcoidia bacterium]|nr:MAG: class I SAM-dependent methyltransferase [Dehalococcoidia bacterium]
MNNLQSICAIGCRTSTLSSLLGKLYELERINGIDIDNDFLTISQRRGIDAKKCNINDQHLPYKDETFDVVLFCKVLEHLQNYHLAMNQIYGIIEKNGTLIITTPNVASLRNRITLLFGKDVHNIYSENQKDVHITYSIRR